MLRLQFKDSYNSLQIFINHNFYALNRSLRSHNRRRRKKNQNFCLYSNVQCYTIHWSPTNFLPYFVFSTVTNNLTSARFQNKSEASSLLFVIVTLQHLFLLLLMLFSDCYPLVSELYQRYLGTNIYFKKNWRKNFQ